MIPHDPSRRQIDPRQLVRSKGPGALWGLLVRHGYVPPDDVFGDLLQALLGHEPLLIEGIRGGGKTALVDTLAKACNLDRYGVSGREGITAEELLYSWDKVEQRDYMADARPRHRCAGGPRAQVDEGVPAARRVPGGIRGGGDGPVSAASVHGRD